MKHSANDYDILTEYCADFEMANSMYSQRFRRSLIVWPLLWCLTIAAGCAASGPKRVMQDIGDADVPRELNKVTLPTYTVEPPDVLMIQAVATLRSPNSRLVPGDRLRVQLKNGLPIDVGVDADANKLQYDAESQIELSFKVLAGTYRIGASGMIDFGPAYGKVAVNDLTVAEADAAIRQHLRKKVGLQAPELMVSLEDVESAQPIAGEHLVRPDGRISLGIHGDVYVAGMTLAEVRAAIEQHMIDRNISKPQVSVDVAAYNSKLYYVITDGGGFGESVSRIPYTGNETVLDAVSQVQGLSEVSSKRIWIARPAPAGNGSAQILDVAWDKPRRTSRSCQVTESTSRRIA
jgi:polysaccharide export outer membrane protein